MQTFKFLATLFIATFGAVAASLVSAFFFIAALYLVQFGHSATDELLAGTAFAALSVLCIIWAHRAQDAELDRELRRFS